MFHSNVLDIFIGLIFIYLLYSLLATLVQEIIATRLAFRAKFLQKAIIRMLEDTQPGKRWRPRVFINRMSKQESESYTFYQQFYGHPLVKHLGERPGISKPAYINNTTFSKVVVDLLRGYSANAGENHAPLVNESLLQGKTSGGNSQPISAGTLDLLRSFWADAQGDLEKFRTLLENWFNETMDRASGWYKKYIQWVLFVIGFSIAVTFNVDSIEIARKLQRDPKLREQLVQQADAFVKAHPDLKEDLAALQKDTSASSQKKITSYEMLLAKQDSLLHLADSMVKADISNVNGLLGIGLNKYKANGFPDLMLSLLGWAITALAISMGAPFWFDLLNKFMKLKASIAPSAKNAAAQTNPSANPLKRVG